MLRLLTVVRGGAYVGTCGLLVRSYFVIRTREAGVGKLEAEHGVN